ncbi:response regulator transcription factor [Oceanobacillus chungangensis]|uniref:Helix-turn-helix transcriptional regulator n=1 Tax=Oceanobacillus chungangensis TaxID=1229152 RepID=A0A3D8PL21_9BACI|nr:helix-turn-helix transcriptional regulator [Oceanobacillus chungangensis]RDW16793.1 helix-turn-helix transcriptional regulator [Oceanobacillus chungangensis]
MNGTQIEITPIEHQIIKLIANEQTNKMIAEELNYSQRSIEYHIHTICKKLEVQTRVGVVCKAFQLHILP